jgi:putative thioredoxin
MSVSDYVFDTGLANFEQDVLKKSMEVPVLVDFWATWCGPCKALGPILEKLADEYNGAFLLAKVDVDQEQQLAGYFQIRSVPTVILIKDGKPVDGFPGALPEGQLREFLTTHDIQVKTAEVESAEESVESAPVDPEQEVIRLRHAITEKPEDDLLKLDLILALLQVGNASEAEKLLDALPVNLATDDRAVKARARLSFASVLQNAPPAAVLQQSIQANPNDLRARHWLGVRLLLEGNEQAALDQFIEMLKQDKNFEDGLPRKTLIDAFRILNDEDLVGTYRRKMSSLLF